MRPSISRETLPVYDLLTMTERATLKVQTALQIYLPATLSTVHMAGEWLCRLDARGRLFGASPMSLARSLQLAYGSQHPLHLIRAKAGWNLLWQVDAECFGVCVSIQTGDRGERVRLSEHIKPLRGAVTERREPAAK